MLWKWASYACNMAPGWVADNIDAAYWGYYDYLRSSYSSLIFAGSEVGIEETCRQRPAIPKVIDAVSGPRRSFVDYWLHVHPNGVSGWN